MISPGGDPRKTCLRSAKRWPMQVYLDAKVEDYIVDIVFATREPKPCTSCRNLEKLIEFGASPRATIFLGQGVQGALRL